MKIYFRTRDEARSIKSKSKKPFRLDKLAKPTPNGHKWALVLDHGKNSKFSSKVA